MKSIQLTQGQFAIVDDDDFEVLSRFKWFATARKHGGFYAKTWHRDLKKKVYLHRFIMNPPDIMEVDHRNGDSLDCRKSNLRVCKKIENRRNLGLRKTNTSGFKGVSKTASNKWMAQIVSNNKNIFLGNYNTKEKAAAAYDKAAKYYHGEFAKTNEVLHVN